MIVLEKTTNLHLTVVCHRGLDLTSKNKAVNLVVLKKFAIA